MVAKTVALITTLAATMAVLLQNLEAISARDLPATIFDESQYYGVCV